MQRVDLGLSRQVTLDQMMSKVCNGLFFRWFAQGNVYLKTYFGVGLLLATRCPYSSLEQDPGHFQQGKPKETMDRHLILKAMQVANIYCTLLEKFLDGPIAHAHCMLGTSNNMVCTVQ